MRTLLATFLLILSSQLQAQTCGDLVAHSEIPAPLTDTTHAYVNLHVYCNEFTSLQNYTVTPLGNHFTIDAYYCYGWLQVITTTNDSIPLGVLAAGDYTYTVNIYNSYSVQTSCMSYTQSDQAAGSFTVISASTSAVEELEQEPKVLVSIHDIMGRETTVEPNKLLIYTYSDGSTEKVFKTE